MIEGKTASILVARLEEENERLRRQLALSESGAKLGFSAFPSHWNLTPQRRFILTMLMKRELVSRETLLSGLPVYWSETATDMTLKVQVCYLRRVLRSFGADIKTIWGIGYQILPEVKDLIRREVEAGRDGASFAADLAERASRFAEKPPGAPRREKSLRTIKQALRGSARDCGSAVP